MNVLVSTAGFIVGWIMIDILLKSIGLTSPPIYRTGMGLVGALIAYKCFS
jgi:hypothetical protein